MKIHKYHFNSKKEAEAFVDGVQFVDDHYNLPHSERLQVDGITETSRGLLWDGDRIEVHRYEVVVLDPLDDDDYADVYEKTTSLVNS